MANLEMLATQLASRIKVPVSEFESKAKELTDKGLKEGLDDIEFTILTAINSFLKVEAHNEFLKKGGQDRAKASKAIEKALKATGKK